MGRLSVAGERGRRWRRGDTVDGIRMGKPADRIAGLCGNRRCHRRFKELETSMTLISYDPSGRISGGRDHAG